VAKSARQLQNTFIDKDTGYDTLMTNFSSAKGRAVFVGFLRSAAPYVGKAQGVSTAQIAAIQEFGSSDGTIPARPFMVPAIDENEKKLQRTIEKLLGAVESKRFSEVAALRILGLQVQAFMRDKIVRGPFKALAAATLKAREQLGIKGTKPLIATGHLVGSVDFEVMDAQGKSGGTE
jgi:hypothetical protein